MFSDSRNSPPTTPNTLPEPGRQRLGETQLEIFTLLLTRRDYTQLEIFYFPVEGGLR